jgi:hypothetical protein
MALTHSPKIVTDGLVFYYDMMNTKKSWKGPPVTNQFTLPSAAVNGFGVENDIFTRIYAGTYGDYDIQPSDYVWRYNVNGSACPYHGWDISTPAGTVVTFSFDYFISPNIIGYPSTNHLAAFENLGSGVSGAYADPTPSIIGVWKRAYFSSTASATGSSRCLLYPGACGGQVATGTGFVLFKNPQVEFNAPGGIPTPFAGVSRSNSASVIDLIGGNTITVNSLTYNSDGTFRFNNSDNKMTLNTNSLISGASDYTIDAIIRPNIANSTDYIFGNYGSANSGGLEYYVNQNKVNNYIQGNVQSSTTLTPNQWYSVCVTRSGNTITHYLNGVADGSGTLSTSISTNNPFTIGNGHDYTSEAFSGNIAAVKVYNKSLTATEVKQNYNAVKERFLGYQALTYVNSSNITVTNNGTDAVTFTKNADNNSWNGQAYTTEAFTAPCTIEFSKLAADGDNGASYAMIGWNVDPTTDSSYGSIDHASYPYTKNNYHIYNNGAGLGTGLTWDSSKKFYLVYDTDGYIRHYNGDKLLYSANYGTGNTVYVDMSLYNTDTTFGKFSDVRVCRRSWNGSRYI